MTTVLAASSLRETDPETGSRWYIHPVTGEQMISVTTVLGATQGKPWIPPWAAKLAAEYAVDNIGMLARLAASEGRDAAVKVAKDQARLLRERKADAGTYVHDVVERLILWSAEPYGSDIALPLLPDHLQDADYDGEPLGDVADSMVAGWMNFVADFRPGFLAAEMAVFHPEMGYAGTLDMICRLRGYGIGNGERLIAAPGQATDLCIDNKTGRHLDVTYREQQAAYRRAAECALPLGQVVPMPPTDAAAVLHLRPEFDRGYRLMLVSRDNDARAWATFTRALEVFRDREAARAKPGKVVYPLRADGTMPPPQLADLDGEGYGRALSPLIKAGITDLDQLTAVEAGDLLAVKGIGGQVLKTIRLMLADHGLHLSGEEPAQGEAA
jgi:hypothetical protein